MVPVSPALITTATKTEASDAVIKPPLKWAGGKRWLVPRLTALWQSHSSRPYVEPFCGGLAVSLGLRPNSALLNDVNPHLINFYRHLQRGLEIKIEMRNDENIYYSHRSRFNELINHTRLERALVPLRSWRTSPLSKQTFDQGGSESAEAAQLFYYLNRTCFNGLCRFNKSGEFNVPFGRHSSITYASDFSAYESVLKNWVFTCGDLDALTTEPQAFIYADPPYDVEFTSYSSGGFSWDDQVRTAESLARHSGPVVLSNQATPRIIKLYKRLGFKIEKLAGPRRISCTGDRTAAREVLATKGL
jgi:DNA adenine methylase